MAGSTFTFKYVKYIKYWLKKGAGTAAIFEGVGISAPLMGRYVGWACGIEWFHSSALICLMAGSTYTFMYVKYIKYWLKKAPERPPYLKALELARRLWGAM